MSSPFQASDKTARKQRRKQSLVFASFAAITRVAKRKRLAFMLGSAGFLFVVTALSENYFLLGKTKTSEPRPEITEIVQPEIPSMVSTAFPVASASGKRARTKLSPEEPQGIALPVASLALADASEKDAPKPIVQALSKKKDIPKNKEKEKSKSAKALPSAPVAGSRNRPLSAAALLKEARALVQAKDYTAAIARYDQVLAQNKKNKTAWTGKLYALQQGGALEDLKIVQQMAAARPDSSAAQAALGHLYVQNGETSKGLGALQQAIELDPDNDNYLLSLAILYDRAGQETEALELYQQVSMPLPASVQQRMEYLSARMYGNFSPE